MNAIKTGISAAGLMALAGCAMWSVHPDSEGWDDLFAKDFSNAEVKAGTWKFDEEGCLTPVTTNMIFTKKSDWHDFMIDTVFAMGPNGNSGIFIYDTEHPAKKIEVQLSDDTDPECWQQAPYQWTGSLYGHQYAFAKVVKGPGEWNRLTIRAAGKHVEVWLNGVKTADGNLDDWTSHEKNPDGTWMPSYQRDQTAWKDIPTTGKIGLQGVHGKTGVRFKYLRIRPL